MPICQYAYMPLCLYAYMPMCQYAYMPICLHAHMPTCLYMPICLYARAWRSKSCSNRDGVHTLEVAGGVHESISKALRNHAWYSPSVLGTRHRHIVAHVACLLETELDVYMCTRVSHSLCGSPLLRGFACACCHVDRRYRAPAWL